MKLLVFLLLISSTLFSQNCEVLTERYYEYIYKGNIITTNEYDVDSEQAFDAIQNDKYIRITTDRGINWYLSDTLTKLFVKGRQIKEKQVIKTLGYVVNNITIDSTTNLFYKEVEDNCFDCVHSIQDMLLSDTSLVNVLNKKDVRKIIVTYVQVRRKKTYGYICVNIYYRFHCFRPETHIYVEDMDE